MRKKSLIIAISIVICDQIIKNVINNAFYYGQLKSIIDNFFYVTKVYNDGAAWSTFSGNCSFLIVISIIALIFLLWYQEKFESHIRTSIAFGLIYGGLFGNMIDRIKYGYVVDYLKVVIGNYNFPIFNLADVAIVIGFVLLVYGIFKGEDKNGDKSRYKRHSN